MATAKVKRVGSTAQRSKELAYEKRVCRLEDTGFLSWSKRSGHESSLEDDVALLSEVGLEVLVVGTELFKELPHFKSDLIPPPPNADLDVMPTGLELLHQKGILVLSYYPMNWPSKPHKATHPEWEMKYLDDGRPIPESHGVVCFNSPYRDWLPEYLSEYLDNVDVDGFYFDDTNWGSHQGEYPQIEGYHLHHFVSCCCPYCEKLFREETGLEIPRKVDFDSLDFRHFVNWRYSTFRGFVHHVFRRVKERHPDAILDLNCYMTQATDWGLGHPLGSLHLEDLGGHFFAESITGSLREISFVGKILRATGTPFAVFCNNAQTLKGFRGAPYAERYSAAVFSFAAIANGGHPCGDPFGGISVLRKDTMKWVYGELKKRRDYIHGETVKYIALHLSQQNRDFRPSELAKNTGRIHRRQTAQKDTHGAYEMLNRSHLLLDLVLDERLTYEHLSQYPVIFLSNSACLSDQQCEELRKVVREGGTLIATHETSLLDELGQKRDGFALADVFGIDYQGPYGGEDGHSVVYVPQEKELASELGDVICFFGQESAVEPRPDAELQVLCTRTSLVSLPGKDLLECFDPKKEYDSSVPTVTANRYGKGQAIYIAADVGGAYLNNPYPPLKRFIARLVQRTNPPLEIEAPEAIEVTAAIRDSGELMIHLVNNPTPLLPWRRDDEQDATKWDEYRSNFFALQEVNSIHNIRVRFNDFKVKSARLPLHDEYLEVTGKHHSVVVPEIELHEVLLVDLED